MIPTMPALGIRFDIGKIKAAAYGSECWKVFWRAVDVQRLGGALLFEGDTAATLDGKENVFCVAVQCADRGVLGEVRAALQQSVEFQEVAALPRFVEGDLVVGEPLPDAGQVDSVGDLVGNAYNSLQLSGTCGRRGGSWRSQANRLLQCPRGRSQLRAVPRTCPPSRLSRHSRTIFSLTLARRTSGSFG